MRRIWMKYVLFLVAVVALVGCGEQEAPAPTEQSSVPASTIVAEAVATDTPELNEPAATATESPTPTETLAPTPTTEPTPTEEAIAEVSDQCLACHADQDQLIDTAEPEEEIPNESSGVG